MKNLVIQAKPLSVNEAFQGRRFKTRAYIDYEKELAVLIPKHLCTSIEGKLEVHYRFFLKNHALTDLDNMLKPLNDTLVKLGVIKDDRYIYRKLVEKIPATENKIEIDIKMLEESPG